MDLVLVLPVLAAVASLPWWLVRRSKPAGLGGDPDQPPPMGVVDPAMLLDLAAAALRSGASVPGTLQALGNALAGVPGDTDVALRRAGNLLLLGADWHECWDRAPAALRDLADALEPAWVDGADPLPLLTRAAQSVRAGRHRRAEEAAARLGVRLVLPLGLCFLPAFILLGLVPVVVSAGGALLDL